MKLHANQQLSRCFYLLLTRRLTWCMTQKFWTQAVWYFHWRQAESKTLAFWPNPAYIQSYSYPNWELAISCPDGGQIVHCCLERGLVPPLLRSKVPRWGEDMHYFHITYYTAGSVFSGVIAVMLAETGSSGWKNIRWTALKLLIWFVEGSLF